MGMTMSEESNDVTKALAAFGAPSIRYHSFGQAQARPPGLAAIRRPVLPTEPPVASPVIVQQTEPVAAPEPLPGPPVTSQAPPMVAPRPAPLPAEPVPLRAPLSVAPGATVAPPPRPLAEWAAPVNSVPVRPLVAPAVPPQQPVHVPAAPSASVMPMPHAPSAAATPSTIAAMTLAHGGVPKSSSSLVDVFDYLAAS